MLHNPASEVAIKLQALTTASRFARRGDVMMRQLGEDVYNAAYKWLEEHGVPFMYSEEEERYVEAQRD